jgi:hypothetical protein
MNNTWERFLNIDRRWIYLLVAVVVIVPFFIRMGLPVVPTDEVRSIYTLMDSLGPDDAIFVGWDFDPGTEAENQPMGIAILRHAFDRHVPVFLTAYSPLGQGLAEQGIASVFDTRTPGNFVFIPWADWEFARDAGFAGRDSLEAAWTAAGNSLPEGAKGWVFEGVDFVHLGYLPYFGLVILGMTSSIANQYPSDAYGNNLREMPILQAHKNLREVDLAVTLAGSTACMLWVLYGTSRVGLPVAFGVTAVMATDYFPYIQSGQIVGMMGGLRGAAEYEVLETEGGYTATTGKAYRGMDVQSLAHILIILLVILGNVAYFAGGFHKKTALKSRR